MGADNEGAEGGRGVEVVDFVAGKHVRRSCFSDPTWLVARLCRRQLCTYQGYICLKKIGL